MRKGRAKRNRRQQIVCTCKMCRQPFYAKNRNKETCSDACRQAYSRWKRANYQTEPKIPEPRAIKINGQVEMVYE